MFRCKQCRRTYNERTGTPFNFIEISTDIVFQVLLLRVGYKLSYREVAEYFLIRGFVLSYEAVRDWEERLLPHLTEQIREKRKGKVGKLWFVDETYVKVLGSWCYLYRGIDEDGNLVDVRLSAHRDMQGTKAFFAKALDLQEEAPQKVATEGAASYPRAIKEANTKCDPAQLTLSSRAIVVSCIDTIPRLALVTLELPIDSAERWMKLPTF